MSSIDRKVQRAAAAKQTKKTRAENIAATKRQVARSRGHQKENSEPLSPEAASTCCPELAKQNRVIASQVDLQRLNWVSAG